MIVTLAVVTNPSLMVNVTTRVSDSNPAMIASSAMAGTGVGMPNRSATSEAPMPLLMVGSSVDTSAPGGKLPGNASGMTSITSRSVIRASTVGICASVLVSERATRSPVV